MKINKFLSVLAVAVGCLTVASGAFATTSTINPAVPAQNSPLSSATIRSNFQAAYNDITTLFGNIVSGLGTVFSVTVTGDGIVDSATPSLAVTTSGSLPLTPIQQTKNTFLAGPTTGSNANPSFRALVGADLPLASGLVFTALDKFNLNAATLPAAQAGAIAQFGNTDTTTSRVECDGFGAACHFSAVAYGGTAASPTTILSAAPMGSFNAFGYNGTAVVGPNAAIRAFASQNWSVGSNGTSVDIATTPNGSTTLTQVCRFENDGGVTCPATVTGGSKGAGTINLGGAGVYVNNVLVGSGGSGSGTVNSGTTPDLAFYATSTGAVSDATGLQYSATTKGLNLNGVNAHSLPANGSDTTGVAIGSGALLLQTSTGANNVAAGNNALNAVTTGTNNVGIGSNAGSRILTDSGETFIGSGAGQNFAIGNTTSTGGETSVGYHALNLLTTSPFNTAVGYQALSSVTGGSGQNTALGWISGNAITTATADTLFGSNTGRFLTTGSFDTYIGTSSGGNDVAGANNTGIGYGSLGSTAGGGGSNSVAIGYLALQVASSSSNTAVGASAGNRVGGGSGGNTIFGSGVGSTTLTTGSNNILVGNTTAVDTPTATTSNYLNIGNLLAGDRSKGILILEGPTTVLTCGTSPTLKSGSNDMTGEVTVGTSSSNSCVVAFANAHTSAPNCIVSNQTNTVTGFGYLAATTTGLTVNATSGLDSSKFDYFCPGASTSTNPIP